MAISATVLKLSRKSGRGADSAPPPSGARVKKLIPRKFIQDTHQNSPESAAIGDDGCTRLDDFAQHSEAMRSGNGSRWGGGRGWH